MFESFIKTNKSLFGILCLTSSFAANCAPLINLPSIPYIADSDGWHFAAGLGVEYEAEYDGSDEFGVEVEPVFAFQYRDGDQMWFAEGTELCWRTSKWSDLMVQLGLRYEIGREEDEAPELAGMGETDDELTGIFEIRYKLAVDWGTWVGGRIMQGDGDFGTLAVLALGQQLYQGDNGEGIEVFAFTTFGSSKFNQRDFGVTEQQSLNSGLPQFKSGSGYRSIGISGYSRWPVADDWQLNMEISYEKYSSDISDSPIALEDYEAEIGLSLVYLF